MKYPISVRFPVLRDSSIMDSYTSYWTKEFSETNAIDIDWNYSEIGPSTSDHMNVTRQLPESHEMNSHSGKSSDSENIFECEVCKGQFPSQSELHFHSCGPTGDTSQRHSVCDESPSKSQLKRCYTTDIGEIDIDWNYSVVGPSISDYMNVTRQLPESHEMNSEENNFIQHVYSHIEVNPFQCDVCHKTFKRQSDFNIHYLIHKSEGPDQQSFQCELCHKTFNLQYNLNKHYLIHAGEVLYQCNLCRKSFGNKGYLKRHYNFTHKQKVD